MEGVWDDTGFTASFYSRRGAMGRRLEYLAVVGQSTGFILGATAHLRSGSHSQATHYCLRCEVCEEFPGWGYWICSIRGWVVPHFLPQFPVFLMWSRFPIPRCQGIWVKGTPAEDARHKLCVFVEISGFKIGHIICIISAWTCWAKVQWYFFLFENGFTYKINLQWKEFVKLLLGIQLTDEMIYNGDFVFSLQIFQDSICHSCGNKAFASDHPFHWDTHVGTLVLWCRLSPTPESMVHATMLRMSHFCLSWIARWSYCQFIFSQSQRWVEYCTCHARHFTWAFIIDWRTWGCLRLRICGRSGWWGFCARNWYGKYQSWCLGIEIIYR